SRPRPSAAPSLRVVCDTSTPEQHTTLSPRAPSSGEVTQRARSTLDGNRLQRRHHLHPVTHRRGLPLRNPRSGLASLLTLGLVLRPAPGGWWPSLAAEPAAHAWMTEMNSARGGGVGVQPKILGQGLSRQESHRERAGSCARARRRLASSGRSAARVTRTTTP